MANSDIPEGIQLSTELFHLNCRQTEAQQTSNNPKMSCVNYVYAVILIL